MPDALDIAKFNLDAFKTRAQVEIDQLEAWAAYNKTMAEVAGIQIENAKKLVDLAEKKVRLKFLTSAIKEYRSALNSLKKQLKAANSRKRRLDTAIKNLARLRWGQSIPPDFVGRAWAGFKTVINECDEDTKDQVFAKTVTAKHLKGKDYSKNRVPGFQCPDPPADQILTAIDLFFWCKKNVFVPRRGTEPYKLLQSLIRLINQGSQAAVEKIEKQIKDSNDQLMKLRAQAWEKIDLKKEPAKKGK